MIGTALLLFAATHIVRMEVDTDQPAGDGTPAFVIGVDNVRRPVVLVSPDTYQDMVRQLEKVNSTGYGRMMIHGKRTHTEFTARHERITTYEDGYRFTETASEANVRERVKPKSAHQSSDEIRARAARVREASRHKQQVQQPVKKLRQKIRALQAQPNNRMSERQRKFREELEQQNGKTVTIIHDAVTGKDKVIE